MDKSDGIVQVIIETPKGSRNKFAFDVEQNVFIVKKVLPAGMTFPYDFGFLPRTLAPDGEPIDVLLLMDEPVFPGIAVRGPINFAAGPRIARYSGKIRISDRNT